MGESPNNWRPTQPCRLSGGSTGSAANGQAKHLKQNVWNGGKTNLCVVLPAVSRRIKEGMGRHRLALLVSAVSKGVWRGERVNIIWPIWLFGRVELGIRLQL